MLSGLTLSHNNLNSSVYYVNNFLGKLWAIRGPKKSLQVQSGFIYLLTLSCYNYIFTLCIMQIVWYKSTIHYILTHTQLLSTFSRKNEITIPSLRSRKAKEPTYELNRCENNLTRCGVDTLGLLLLYEIDPEILRNSIKEDIYLKHILKTGIVSITDRQYGHY